MKRYVYGELKKIMDACDDLDTLKESLKNDFSMYDIPFDNFSVYTNSNYIDNHAILASIREAKFAPLFFFLYIDETENIHAYIPVNQFVISNGKYVRKPINKDIKLFITDCFRNSFPPMLKKMAVEFHDNVAATNKEVNKFTVMSDMEGLKKSINDAKKYFASINVSNDIGFFGLFANAFYRISDYDYIDSLRITKYMVYKDMPIAVAKVNRKNDIPYTVFLYRSVEDNNVYKSGRLNLFIPLYGNTIGLDGSPYIARVATEAGKQNLNHMLEDFAWYATLDSETKSGDYSFPEMSGIVADTYKKKKWDSIIIGRAKKTDVQKIHNQTAVMKAISKYVDDVSKAKVEHDLEFYGSYVIANRVSIDGYYPIMAYEYINTDGEYEITVTERNNYLCNGKGIPTKYGVYVKFGEAFEHNTNETEEYVEGCHIYRDGFFAPRDIKEEEDEIGEVYEVRHAKPKSGELLKEKVVSDKVLDAVEDNLREEITSLTFDTTIYQHNDFDYMMMDAVNSDGESRKIAFFIDTMNQLRAFIAYNTYYAKEEFEASIIPSNPMF